jgi:cytochrome d ubiquinol oxidase subunit II
MILGTLVQGVKVENGAYAGGAFDWLTPFSILCGFAVVAGYALLGATWLLIKTEGSVAALVVLLGWWALNDPKREVLPFLCAIALFFLGYTGLVISNFPYLIPPSLTVWEAAAAPASQLFMLFGTLIMLPIILGYTGFIYWMFRGKIREGEGYH